VKRTQNCETDAKFRNGRKNSTTDVKIALRHNFFAAIKRMGKTKDYLIRQRVLNEALITAQVVNRCTKTRNSIKCKFDEKCFKNFGDALDTVKFVEEVKLF